MSRENPTIPDLMNRLRDMAQRKRVIAPASDAQRQCDNPFPFTGDPEPDGDAQTAKQAYEMIYRLATELRAVQVEIDHLLDDPNAEVSSHVGETLIAREAEIFDVLGNWKGE